MRIIIYVMSFFMISAEKANDEKELFKSEKYSRHEKYPNLQNSCNKAEGKNGFLGSIKGKYDSNNSSCLSGKYYNEDVIKKGKIYTETDSIVSGIDITETISTDDTNTNKQTYTYIPTRLECDSRSATQSTSSDVKHVVAPETSKYDDLEYVIMEGSYIYGYYECETKQKKMKFQLSDAETEEKIIKKIDISCTLRLKPTTTMDKFFTDLLPTLSTNEKDSLKKLYNSYVQFELRFSYICKFVSPLQTFVNKNILQYKILNFTVNGYQLKKFKFSPQCIGLTYCLKHLNTKEYVSNLEEYFLYKFGNTEITNEGS
ncbi:uncharacterized protein LOC142333432 isoform X11 [Lycorma delicatula]|uniref:uncharacterized protein LOC142333432 isoform X11 n=1 Tax=Lycorma delicatula TaxID=130591 RepID=UPI003F511CFD